MNILIIGSGATGGLIGARLVERGKQVTFLVRPERKVQLMTQGLQLRAQFGRFRKPVHAIAPDEVREQADLVIVAVRAQEFETALDAGSRAIGVSTVILPVVEGIRHVELATEAVAPRVLIGVLEARMMLDADGVLVQRPPVAELSIGALRDADEETGTGLVELLGGRGLLTSQSARIRGKAWERFVFMASAVAATALAGRPLRDSLRFAHGSSNFSNLLREAHRIGVAAGFAPDQVAVRQYEKSFLLEGRPIQPPPMIASGRAGDESAFLLSEMVAMARRARTNAMMFDMAWRCLMAQADASTPRNKLATVSA